MNDDHELKLISVARRQAAKARSWSGGGSFAASGDSAKRATDALPNYEIIREIHRGGQGVVYLARQKSTGRQVAVKVMREGPFAGRAEQFRFEREVQILAALKHPNIVTIHDSGTAGGFFHFAMEYIDGRPLDEHARSATLSLRDKLELFVQICDAVNAAHLRGIIHRDLKPGNIRVDTDGRPHVLDFGLAKSSVEDASEVSVTHSGQFVGSLPWSSPEQAEGRLGDLDVRTDVYSLGVLLFHLLTGQFPYETRGPLRAVMNTIVNAEPIIPSSLSAAIPADVDTIVLKCLSKAADRRYQTAGDLARDIRQYLAGEAIDARRDHTLYVVGKLIRRHRGPVAAMIALVALVAASAVMFSMMYKEQRALREESDRQTAVAKQERERAEAHALDARQKLLMVSDTASFMLEQVSTKLSGVLGSGPAKTEILQKTYERFEALSKEQSDDPALRLKLAQTRRHLGLIASDLGKYDESSSHATDAKALFKAILEAEQENVDALVGFSGCCTLIGGAAVRKNDYEAAAAEYMAGLSASEKALAIRPDDPDVMNRFSNVCGALSTMARTRGNRAETTKWLAKACAVKQQLMERYPGNVKYLREYGLCEYYMARDEFEAGRAEEARSHFLKAIEFNESLLAKEPSQTGTIENLGLCYYQMSLIDEQAGRSAQSLNWARKACDMNRKRLIAEPTNLNYQYMLATGLSRAADIANSLLQFSDAASFQDECVTLYRRLLKSDPANRSYRTAFHSELGKLGRSLNKSSRYADSERCLVEAIDFGESLVKQDAPNDSDVLWLAWNCMSLGNAQKDDFRQYLSARANYQRAIDLLENAARRAGPSGESTYAEPLHECYSTLAVILEGMHAEKLPAAAREKADYWRARLMKPTGSQPAASQSSTSGPAEK